MKLADLELVVAYVASIKVLKMADFKECPHRSKAEQLLQVVSALIKMHPVSFAQYYLEDNLLTLLLDAINDAEHVLLRYVLAVSREGQHKVTVSDLRQGAAFGFLCVFSFLCSIVVCSCLLLEGDGVELLNALSVDDGVPGLFLALVIFNG